jgi:predicted Fe-Mo cluster-binding NifX family protein
MVDEATGQVSPIPIPVLQEWGVKCGVAPGELTEEALMEAPANQVPNVNPDV